MAALQELGAFGQPHAEALGQDGRLRADAPGSNGGDVGGDYAFSKYNKKVDMLMYNDEEYEVCCSSTRSGAARRRRPSLRPPRRFDLRFLVAHDRWEREKTRTVEEMKSRYYAIARRLIEARADNPEEAATHPIIKDPFNEQHETDRKLALGDQMEPPTRWSGRSRRFWTR